jgi:uncharacterized protein YjiS (DUF1127 family)
MRFFPASHHAQTGIAAVQNYALSHIIEGSLQWLQLTQTRLPLLFLAKGLIATTFETIQRWNDVRRTRAVLSKLSDRELHDIGLCRGDIEDVAQKSAL